MNKPTLKLISLAFLLHLVVACGKTESPQVDEGPVAIPSGTYAIDRNHTEDAYAMVKRLATEEGLLVGVSSGANVVAALKVAREAGSGVFVTVFCDAADKYLSEEFWTD